MLDEVGRSAEAVREYERALAIHVSMAAADPVNDRLKMELASDYNRLATAQVRLGARAAALANHTRAVDMARALQAKNPADVEWKVSLALALGERADAHANLARRPSPAAREADLAAAERDYAESVGILTDLQKAGAIAGTDLETLGTNRKALERVRTERARISN